MDEACERWPQARPAGEPRVMVSLRRAEEQPAEGAEQPEVATAEMHGRLKHLKCAVSLSLRLPESPNTDPTTQVY